MTSMPFMGYPTYVKTVEHELKDQPALTKLVVDLTNLGPDDAFSSIPYMKGSTFLRYLEDTLGGSAKFEKFLQSYLEKYKYKSVETQDFKSYLYEYWNATHEAELVKIDWDKWLYGEGMPPIIPPYDTSMEDQCQAHADLWAEQPLSVIRASDIFVTKPLKSSQVIEFLSLMVGKKEIVDLNKEKIDFMAEKYGLNETKNAEIRFRFMRLCIRARLMERMDDIIAFANSNFRMKFVRPVYRDLAAWPEGKPIAVANFEKVKTQMMKVCSYGVCKDLGL